MSYAALLNQSASFKNPDNTRDKYGRPGLGASSNIRCRVERRYKTVKTEQREREPIHAVAFTSTSDDVQIGAQFTYDSVTYRVITRSDVPGYGGNIHHHELNLQEWSFGS